MNRQTPLIIAALIALLCLNACSAPHDTLSSLPRLSLTPELDKIYQSTCKNCHANNAMGAPRTGDLKAWQVVFNKPFELIIERVINGYQGMPPLGQCFDCDQTQLETLVHYMSRPAELPQPAN
jgi:cytochrome c5